MTGRIAVVLFNLGGPDGPDAVRPFLFNLFNDPAIIGAPGPVRWLLAQLISRRRAPVAQEIYRTLGGGSPLVENTRVQADALAAELSQRRPERTEIRVFTVMRYWHPRADQVAKEVAAFAPSRTVLLPLYPQYSTTTSGSSLAEWRRVAAARGVKGSASAVCCYPVQAGLIEGMAAAIEETARPEVRGNLRLLFSAHGLPKKIVAGGDPYQRHVEETARALGERLGTDFPDRVVCYQSRVGPLEWIGPSTEGEIARAGAEGKDLLVVPIAFVSEHSETLVELDVEYAELARKVGVGRYLRAPTVDARVPFIGGLADLVEEALAREGLAAAGGRRICPESCGLCAMEAA